MSEPDWVETWKAHTSAFDRVRSIVMTTDAPRSAGWLADRAAVAETTARDHLERLAEMGVVRATDSDGTRVYAPDPAYVRFREIRELVRDHEPEELAGFTVDVKQEIETIRDAYGADSPTELRERAAAANTGVDEARELLRAASDVAHFWYRVSLLEDAISRYDEYRSGNPAVA